MSWKGESKRHSMAARGVRTKNVKLSAEQYNKMVSDFADSIIDVLSSGYADTPWDLAYEQGITDIYNEIPDNMKEDVWRGYIDRINEAGIEYIREGELESIARLFKKKIPTLDYGEDKEYDDDWE